MHVTTLARRLGAAALVAGLALGAAGCSGDSSGDADATSSEQGSEEPSAEAPEESAEESAEDTEPAEETGDDAEAPEELSPDEFFPAVMAALQDAESFRFSVTTTTAGATQEATGEGRFTDSGAEVRATSTGAQAVESILIDQVLYLRSEQLGLGDKWAKIDLKGQEGTLYGFIAKATDPQATMKALESPEKLELVGTEDVDGVSANHYRITIDSKQYASAMGLPAQMGSFLPDEIVQELWVDGENRPLKHFSELEIPTPGGGEPTTSTTEGSYSDFGIDVEIEAPPASEITDAPALPGAA